MASLVWCPDAVAWGDVATWLASIGTIAAVIVALRTSRDSLRAVQKLREEDQALLAAERKEEAEALAVVIHHALYMLGSSLEGTAKNMRSQLDAGLPANAFVAFKLHTPTAAMGLVQHFSNRLFILPSAVRAAVLTVLADWHSITGAPPTSWGDQAPMDIQAAICENIHRSLVALLRNVRTAMDLIVPLANEARPGVHGDWNNPAS